MMLAGKLLVARYLLSYYHMIVAVVKYSPGFEGNRKAIDLAVDL